MADMAAVEISAPGGPEVLRPCRRPIPSPAADEILIRIAAAGVNRPDALQRAGAYDPPPGASDLPGLEAAGEVVEVGGAVSRWRMGDRVTALLPGGGYAEYAVTPAAHALPVPEGLDMAEAAALPETLFTVWSTLVDRARLRAGETLLVHGGSSGIGTTALQLGRLLGARVVATAGSAAKVAACEALGARALNYRDEDFVRVVRGFGGADVVLDMVGGPYISRNLKALAPDGRLVQIAFLEGASTDVTLAPLMVRRQTITGATLRPQSVAAKAAMAAALEQTVWPAIETGRVRPIMDSRHALSRAADAHKRMERSDHIGKLVLVPDP